MALLRDIEVTTLEIWDEFPSLNDKDVEWVYDQLKTFFKKSTGGNKVPEPLSTADRRQALIDELLNMIEDREEIQADDQYINNPLYTHGGYEVSSLPALYVMAFSKLIDSVRLWTKEKEGKDGYLRFISNQVI